MFNLYREFVNEMMSLCIFDFLFSDSLIADSLLTLEFWSIYAPKIDVAIDAVDLEIEKYRYSIIVNNYKILSVEIHIVTSVIDVVYNLNVNLPIKIKKHDTPVFNYLSLS